MEQRYTFDIPFPSLQDHRRTVDDAFVCVTIEVSAPERTTGWRGGVELVDVVSRRGRPIERVLKWALALQPDLYEWLAFHAAEEIDS